MRLSYEAVPDHVLFDNREDNNLQPIDLTAPPQVKIYCDQPLNARPLAKNNPLVRGLLLAVQSNANPSENPTGFEGHKDEDDEREGKEGSLPHALSLNFSPTTQLPLFCQDQEQVFLLRSALRAEVSASPQCDPGKYLTVSVECLGGGGIRRASNI